MEYLRLLYELPGVVAGTTILAYVSPWKIAPRFVPLLMFLVAMLVLRLPEWVSMSLCLTIPAAWLQSRLGIELHGHEPVKITVPKLRKPKVELRKFVTRAYPDPSKETEAPAAEEDAPVPEHDPGQTVTTVPRYVPAL